ncbi:GGDEF domain-containing protein [Microvirga sp. 2YAF29]|uniref:GGDEF domain-containing protein n=1 Tax=Microvirga sp. 2YAF29 TaxID=3233031 RepID=UPI003F9B3006
MKLDPATLHVAFVLLSAVLGLLLIFAWRQNRKVEALAWWGAAFCLICLGIGLVNHGKISGTPMALLAGNALGVLSHGALYAGCVRFNGRRGILLPAAAGPLVWIAAFPFIADEPQIRLMLVAFLTGVYASFSAWELWKNAPQPLASQRVAVLLLAGLGCLSFLRGWLGITLTSIPWIDAFASRWSSEMALFLVVFTPTMAFIFLSMAKEKVEYGYKQAAFSDPLTGVPNRRAFMNYAMRLIERRAGRPITCLLFDLDNFKSINDGYGHDAGDRVLMSFGDVLARHLPPQSFGRLGGEEFAAVLLMNSGEAIAVADDIRHALCAAGHALLGAQAQVTVSIGCASSLSGKSVGILLQEADTALYKAKDYGRNVVISA